MNEKNLIIYFSRLNFFSQKNRIQGVYTQRKIIEGFYPPELFQDLVIDNFSSATIILLYIPSYR